MADGITRIAVEGFKSIAKRQEIEIAPLTILAGANSSGKSSIMQPLLMLKQTLEATYDPGPLKIDGPNVTFTRNKEFLSRIEQDGQQRFGIEISAGELAFETAFAEREREPGLGVTEQAYCVPGSSLTLRPNMSCPELQEQRELLNRPNRSLIISSQLGKTDSYCTPKLRARSIHSPSTFQAHLSRA